MSVRAWLVRRLGMNAIASPLHVSSISPSNRSVWTGRVLGALPALFLTFDGVVKVLQLHWAMDATAQIGFSTSVVFPLGVVELACVVAYLFPRTAALGTTVLTAYLGGAVATHVRLGQPFVLPILFAVILWAGLYLRDERVRALVGPAAKTGR
jgi:hypothetical protein